MSRVKSARWWRDRIERAALERERDPRYMSEGDYLAFVLIRLQKKGYKIVGSYGKGCR